jgi:hypothetical protein
MAPKNGGKRLAKKTGKATSDGNHEAAAAAATTMTEAVVPAGSSLPETIVYANAGYWTRVQKWSAAIHSNDILRDLCEDDPPPLGSGTAVQADRLALKRSAAMRCDGFLLARPLKRLKLSAQPSRTDDRR